MIEAMGILWRQGIIYAYLLLFIGDAVTNILKFWQDLFYISLKWLIESVWRMHLILRQK